MTVPPPNSKRIDATTQSHTPPHTRACFLKKSKQNRSKDILGDMSQPRIFSLQKLVEVADFNMDSRGRIVWANVWGVLGEHFSKLGAHPNRYVGA